MKFTKEHEWVQIETNTATVGITDFAQKQLGDIVSIDLPKIGSVVKQGKEIAMIDSMKASSPVYSPISGKVTDANKELEASPQTINKSAQHEGWIAKIEIMDSKELDNLMTEEQYKKFLEESK